MWYPNRMELVVDSPERLDKFLARQLPDFSRSRLVKEIEAGRVMVDGEVATKSGVTLQPGETVELELPEDLAAHDLTPFPMELDIVYQDDDVIVVNKSRGLATHPAPSLKEPSLVNALLAMATPLSAGTAAWRPGIVHRLDKETTGLIMIAKNDAAHASLAGQIERKSAERRYIAIVAGDLEREMLKIDAPIGRSSRNRQMMAVEPSGKPAVTYVRRVRRCDAGTVVVCRLETGRTHQIRVHLSAMAHPIIGDEVYAPKAYHTAPMQLHAAYIGFDQPTTGKRIEVVAAVPEDWLGAEPDAQEAAIWP